MLITFTKFLVIASQDLEHHSPLLMVCEELIGMEPENSHLNDIISHLIQKYGRLDLD